MGNVETWKKIPGYPGYKISDRGRVASYRHVELRVLKPRVIGNRCSIQLRSTDGKKRTFQISHLVLWLFGDRPEGPCNYAFHINNDFSDNRIENLQWQTINHEEGNLVPVTLDGKEYVSVRDFANTVNKSYTTIYLLAKYGNGTVQLEHVKWNNRILILLSETKKMEQIASVGRPPKEKADAEKV